MSDPSMVLTVLATAVVRSESLLQVYASLALMKVDEEQAEYLTEIEDAAAILDIVAKNNSYKLKDEEEEGDQE